MPGKPAFKFPHAYGGIHIEQYNSVIRNAAKQFGCKPIDLYSFHTPYASLDGTHPTAKGMETIASMIIKGIEAAKTALPKNDPDDIENRVIEGKYRILKQINRSSFVEVYLARIERLNRLCVLKAYRKAEINLYARDFSLNEAHTMMELNHPGLPRVYDIIEDERYTYVVREYIEGDTLDEIVRKNGAQPVERVVDWAKQLCDVLQYLHSRQPPRIYRGMKPANILLQPDGRVRLIDVPAMSLYDKEKEYDPVVLGTKGFAAPEQYGGAEQTDCRTDIFGLGMTMHYLLTGMDPTDPPYITQSIRKIDPELPVKLEKIIQKCIEPDRAKRYQNVDSLLRAIIKAAAPARKTGWISRLFGKC